MKQIIGLFIALPLLFLMVGCTASTFIVKDSKGNPSGFPFYFPQPYILITEATDSKCNITSTTQLIYLPDPRKSQFVSIKRGSGEFHGDLKLKDGWMLAEIDQKSDTKTAETLQALASLAKSVKPGIQMLEVPSTKIPQKIYISLYKINLETPGLEKIGNKIKVQNNPKIQCD